VFDNGGKTLLSVGANANRKESPSEPTDPHSQDEDCFCCCAHIVPGMVFVAPTLMDLKSPVTVQVLAAIPTPPLFRPFHPPRFA
jgi:hypothetical protein